MGHAVAPEFAATAPREREWRWFVLALLSMVFATVASSWPPSMALVGGAVRLLLPVEQFALLVLVAIASCAVVGWLSGGRLVMAILWLSLAGWVVWKLPLPLSGYGAFARGWALSVGAAFGLTCLARPARPFLQRALTAIAVAAVVTMAGLSRPSGTGSSFDDAQGMFTAEYAKRAQESLSAWQVRTSSASWKAFISRWPSAAVQADRATAGLEMLAGTSGSTSNPASTGRRPLLLLAPALLMLESLLALGLGWASYHRLSRVRIGPPLAALRDVRFHDQLVWGLVVGATILLLPTLAEWRALGANLLFFFGTLYALRGAGVLTWWMPERVAVMLPIALIVLVPLLGPFVVLAAMLVATFGLGLGDTWRDFRSGAKVHRPGSLR